MKQPNWKLALHKGDEVFIDNPFGQELNILDDGGPTLGTTIIIAEIRYLDNECVEIISTEGEMISCFIHEIH